MFSSFMLNTWLVGTIVALVAGAAGFFVVLRGATFAAHALPLGTFPGAAFAGLLGIAPIYGLIAFAGLGVVGIFELSRAQRADVATALTLIFLLGLGTLFLSLSSQYANGVYALLFGDILGVSTAALIPVAVIGAAVIAAIALTFRPLLLCAISPDLGAAAGISPRRTELLFLVLIALATATALPVVGALLVFSLMVGPPSLARALTSAPLTALCLSAAIAVATIWSAIALSYTTNDPVGFFVGTLAALSYAAGRLWRSKPALSLK
jgi:zinc/manganese transport system permease protein